MKSRLVLILLALLALPALAADSLGGTPREKSSDLAISAANRVFNTVQLKGLSRPEIGKLLRSDLRSPKYGYIAPFWPVKKGAQVFRFDSGYYGWQFDIYFDGRGRSVKMEKRWIH